VATTALPRRTLRASMTSTALVIFVALQAGIGLLAAQDPQLALAAAVVLAAAVLAVISPLGVAAVAFPAVLATRRLGGGGIDLSYADAVLVVATALALPFVPWRSRVLRNVLSALGLYLVVLAVTIIANPSVRAVIELFHRLELVAGAVMVGAAIAATGRTRFALRLLVAACAGLAVAAIAFTLSHGWAPAYPLGVNKNAAGFFLTCALLLLVVVPRHVELPRAASLPIQVLILAGLAACQSRASAATFVSVLLISSVRRTGSKALIPIVGTVALVAMIWTTSQRLTEDSPGAQFNSLNTRIDTYDRTMELWQGDPIFGVGVRFFREPALAAGEPHNLIIASLGESGVVGTAGFVAFNIAVIAMFRRRKDALGHAALYLTIAHAIDSMAGIFWVAGTGTLPWLVVGLAVGLDPSPTSAGDVAGQDHAEASRSTTRSTNAALGAPSHTTDAWTPASSTVVSPTSITHR
jgi:polysaccharide biosynthesis protein PslJ